jgi:hypothetical protein
MAPTSEYVKALRGPVLLATLGLLMAGDQAGHYSFSRTWPGMLVVAGLMILAEKFAASQGGPQS